MEANRETRELRWDRQVISAADERLCMHGVCSSKMEGGVLVFTRGKHTGVSYKLQEAIINKREGTKKRKRKKY